MDNILFQITLYRDRTIAVRGRPVEGKDYHEAVVEVLYILADAIGSGAVVMDELSGQAMWRTEGPPLA